jgi:hypothetical protein
MDGLDDPMGAVADHRSAVGAETSVVLTGGDFVADVKTAARRQVEVRTRELCGRDALGLNALVEAVGGIVGRREHCDRSKASELLPAGDHLVFKR